MAEDRDDSQRTEEPTQKKLEDARKKGDVPKSMEAAGFLVLSAAAISMAALSGPVAGGLARRLRGFFQHSADIPVDAAGLSDIAGSVVIIGLFALAAPLGALMVASFLGHVGQTGFLFSAERMKPKLSKLSPLAGFKRMFGPQGIANFLKGVGKLTIVGAAAAFALWPRRDDLEALPALDIASILPIARDAALALMIAALSAYAIIAVADYSFQRMSFMKRQRMSRQDIKDELKQSDGDPQVKAKLRQIRQEKARQRMMAAVPDATVVVMNPTHFAVALKYEQGETPAPVCVAKGVDDLALRIRDVAKENDVPVVEDPPLARALYAGAELDREIPSEHFAAVAKVIGYVLTLARRRNQRPGAVR